ncbi:MULTISPECIES: UDP-glucose--hexose-1-phosphate uridylyltransferase [Bacillaceae]|uniref:Galactose-1-phosphate uridylyltransferase n=1 Tax=Evansella alkalicola TaxID=745819 RepID=A0ABS6JYZ6_9BACI|nr:MULTISPECIES: UDP-glucose--hexose-1-phosphate uridylyltransferase [Bacillaceae]MBU9723316.1 UDP-glucose--hexose-1-phosphate uridylyltransferase [Bacillus alkalicola]
MSIYQSIEQLLKYGLEKNFFEEMDRGYVRNRVFEVLQLEGIELASSAEYKSVLENKPEPEQMVQVEGNLESPVPILEAILDWAVANGRLKENTVTERDLFDTAVMGCLLGRPSDIYKEFKEQAREYGMETATKEFYQFSQDAHYIRTDRIAKNESWFTETAYGPLEVTINLSKPEKDPKEIEAAKKAKATSYPKCVLCKENVGYSGRVNHPARQNLRTIPIQLGDERWHFQFSPYVYYNEHAIVFKDEHEPMKISKRTFERLLQFVEQFPHYFLGSNADLPIVGGSILSHDHFQGGNYVFPMATAKVETPFSMQGFPEVKAGIVKWPMSVIRLQGKGVEDMVEAAEYIRSVWATYSDEEVDILAFTEDTPHNTVTPIARMNDGMFELDLVLRNNRTNEKYPFGIFHPHEGVHHIKKENIGLIEVMGLAVLPGRLKKELVELANAISSSRSEVEILENPTISKHYSWAKKVLPNKEWEADECLGKLKDEVSLVFVQILEHAGVYKRDEQGKRTFRRLVEKLSKGK